MSRATKQMKIRKGDTVEVLSGKDRGKRGVVDSVDPSSKRVIVEGIAIIKRHTKPRPAQNAAQATQQQGGVIEKPSAIHVSNVAVISPASGKPTRVGWRITEDGRKIRVSRRDNVDLDETKGK